VPIPGLQLRIVDDDGNEQLIGDVGEIVLKGPNIMTGYWNKPEETAQTLRDGWLHTGDLGYVDDQGFVFIVDRKKDLIIKGGYNIYPREIEEVIYQLPEVDMAAVIGVPRARSSRPSSPSPARPSTRHHGPRSHIMQRDALQIQTPRMVTIRLTGPIPTR
jgi:acyl-CoA synthetase (AMP-forming)/AMP-acid ligase II